MKEPLISIIIPMYNAEAYIEKCAFSLLGQTYRNIEFIFVNDCSSDETVSVLMKCVDNYPNRKEHVKIISNSRNSGVAYSRNVGLSHATGEYIGWCDADDWVDECMYDALLIKAQETDSDIVYCDYYQEGIDKAVVHVADTSDDKGKLLSDYLIKGLCPLWNKLISKKLFTENNIHFLSGQDYCEDFNVSIKLLFYAKKVTCIRQAYYHYRENPGSICHLSDKAKRLSGLNNVVDVYEFLLPTKVGGEFLERCLIYNVLNAKLWLWAYDKDITSLQIHPETNRYIFSNPFLGSRGKLVAFVVCSLYSIMMWMLSRVRI